MNIEEAKAIALSKILKKIGLEPVRQKGYDVWYNSPFRKERTASFHINTHKNVWYDFGEAKGGDSVDFVCAFLKCHHEDHTPVDALRWLSNMIALPLSNYFLKASQETIKTSNKLVIQKVYNLHNKALISYLVSRGISPELADMYLKEVAVKNLDTQKVFYVIGFENEDGGFELRNRVFKGSVAPKTVSVIRGKLTPAQEVHVFEGFIDFLSAVAHQKDFRFDGDVIVLNSTACLTHAFPYIKDYSYKKLHAWMDNDASGEKTSLLLKRFAEQSGLSFESMNKLYSKNKDVNDWHANNK